MREPNVRIRPVEERDFPFILRVNEENVEVLSPMDEKRLRTFRETAELLLVVEVDGSLAAFLIALREEVEFYNSENYLWFRRNYSQFLYIDRIVIDKHYRGMGVGRMLYQAVFDHARATNVPFVTAEIDTEPYNEVSLSFHTAMGFREVGVQRVRGGSIKVSLQEAAVALNP